LDVDIRIRESIEFPGNSSEKSHALACESTSVASMLCDITTRVDAKAYSITLFNYKSKESIPVLREVCEREIRLVAE